MRQQKTRYAFRHAGICGVVMFFETIIWSPRQESNLETAESSGIRLNLYLWRPENHAANFGLILGACPALCPGAFGGGMALRSEHSFSSQRS